MKKETQTVLTDYSAGTILRQISANLNWLNYSLNKIAQFPKSGASILKVARLNKKGKRKEKPKSRTPKKTKSKSWYCKNDLYYASRRCFGEVAAALDMGDCWYRYIPMQGRRCGQCLIWPRVLWLTSSQAQVGWCVYLSELYWGPLEALGEWDSILVWELNVGLIGIGSPPP